MDLSYVIPAYNEADSLPELIDIIKDVSLSQNWDYEIIVIDDGSTDNTLDVLEKIKTNLSNLKYISFRRNYGKAAGLSVGFEKAQGDYVATLDADLQDDPHEIPEMVNLIKNQNWDMVSGWKKHRKDPKLSKNIPSKFFNFVTSTVSGLKLHDYNCGLKVYKNSVVKSIKLYGELHRYIPVLAHWGGFRVTEKPVVHHERKYGVSKYGLNRFVNGFLDLLTVVFLNKYTKKPLHFFGLIGTFFMLIGIAINLYFGVVWVVSGHIHIRPLLLLGVFLVMIAIQFYSIGLIGELIIQNSREESYNIKKIVE